MAVGQLNASEPGHEALMKRLKMALRGLMTALSRFTSLLIMALIKLMIITEKIIVIADVYAFKLAITYEVDAFHIITIDI